MDIPNEFVLQMIGTFEAFSKTLMNRYQAEQEKDQSSRITVYFDGYSEETNDLCESGKQGGETMPPRYADGTFRLKNVGTGLLEYRFMHLGNQKSVCGKSKEECWNKRTEMIKGTLKAEKAKHIFAKIPTFGEWATIWFETYKNPYNGSSSIKDIKLRIRQSIEFLDEAKPLNKISSLEIQSLINTFSDRPPSQKKLYMVLCELFEKARINKYIKENPCEAIKLMPHKAKRRRALEFFEQQSVFENCNPQKYRELFFFACCTGIRIGKILELTAENIDEQKKVIRVVKKQRRGLTETYCVPYLDELWEIIQKPVFGKLFPDLTVSGLETYFNRLYSKLGIEGAMLHTFRHTFLSTCYHCGIDIKKLQTWAGHATIDITMDVYTHLMENGNSVILEYIRKLVENR